MTTFFDFDEFFGDFGFDVDFTKSMLREFNDVEKMVKSGKTKGKWDIKQIDEPDRKGFVIQGHFWSAQPVEPFEPFKPWRRRPMPKRPFEVPEKALNEVREPLTDVFDEDKTVKIYVELPGEEEDDIQLKVAEGKVEVKAKKFYKIVEVPSSNVDIEKASSKYKNGVLEVTILKKDKSPVKID
jgi:HSP20 family molecular chaperone IbpA